MGLLMDILFPLPDRRSYYDSAKTKLIVAWETLDAARRLLNKEGEGELVDLIESLQAEIKRMIEEM
jgi:hypothetical protein